MKKSCMSQEKKNFHIPKEEGFDPEMLFVECSKCGSPIIWEQGRATEILHSAGIDAMELDPYCILLTDGCPRCTKKKMFHVQIYRVEEKRSPWGGKAPIGNA